MTHRRAITIVFSLLLVSTLAGSIVTVRALDRVRANRSDDETLYIPSATALKRLSLGYSGLLADIYWTRAVQYFGARHHEHSRQYKLLYPLLDITTQLDPHLTIAYEFGSIFLSQPPPEGAGEPQKAAALVERGIRDNPEDWRLYYHLGYIQALELKDYRAAAETFRRGSEIAGAHPWMRVLAATMAQHGGEPNTARYLWMHIYDSATDNDIKQNAMKHLRALDVDGQIEHLEKGVRDFEQQTGQHITSFAPMVAARWLPGLPMDPLGHPYRLGPDGHVYVTDPQELPFITRGIPPGAEKPVTAVPF